MCPSSWARGDEPDLGPRAAWECGPQVRPRCPGSANHLKPAAAGPHRPPRVSPLPVSSAARSAQATRCRGDELSEVWDVCSLGPWRPGCCWWRTHTCRSARGTCLPRCGARSTRPTSSSTPATGSTRRLLDEFEARARAARRRVRQQRPRRAARAAARRWPASRSRASGSASCTRPASAKGREERCSARVPRRSTSWSSGTATSRGTRPAPTGLRLLNPGSPTDRRRQPHCTYMTATADAGRLRDVTLHTLAR